MYANLGFQEVLKLVLAKRDGWKQVSEKFDVDDADVFGKRGVRIFCDDGFFGSDDEGLMTTRHASRKILYRTSTRQYVRRTSTKIQRQFENGESFDCPLSPRLA